MSAERHRDVRLLISGSNFSTETYHSEINHIKSMVTTSTICFSNQ